MSTFTQILYQIIYSTKNREPVLLQPHRSRIFSYMAGIIQNKNCHVYIINGVEDHIHIVTSLHPGISLSNFVKDLKIGTSYFIKNENLIPNFHGWQEGYGGFTYSRNDRQNLIDYVKGQEEHHKKVTFLEEYMSILKEHDIQFDEKYLL
ncbi:MAG: IS200/IS605 family transposase [Saprospiraceae bacterium]|nr:IS200/IS605 family transposase [Saprospiraceae bacterium]